MNYYSIKDLENYSGIKAHTIRIWEKRYNLLYPVRTDTNIRKYDDDQLVKLLNIVTLLESGWKISKVSKLSKDELIKTTQQCFEENGHKNYLVSINQLVAAMFEFDEPKFDETLNLCIERLGIYVTITEVAYPLLQRIAMMWRLEEISPAQEHFASNLIRQKLIAAIDALPSPSEKSTSSFALFLPELEYHEIGLLMASYVLKERGFTTYYLGSNTPIEAVEKMTQKCRPSHLFTFLITRKTPEEIEAFILDLSKRFKDQKIWMAGHKSILALLEHIPENLMLLQDLTIFDQELSTLN